MCRIQDHSIGSLLFISLTEDDSPTPPLPITCAHNSVVQDSTFLQLFWLESHTITWYVSTRCLHDQNQVHDNDSSTNLNWRCGEYIVSFWARPQASRLALIKFRPNGYVDLLNILPPIASEVQVALRLELTFLSAVDGPRNISCYLEATIV